ncbi:MAG: hypothetical protein HYW50_05065 [Candidatus Diapherotrites archaeon]|nr:hypothetical protein [Candidatus Diapherotrites archaeon]
MANPHIKTRYGYIQRKELKLSEIPTSPVVRLNYSVEDLNNDKKKIKFVNETADFYFLNVSGNVTSIPKHLSPKLAYFIGYFLGDGGLKNIWKTFKKFNRFEYKMKIADEFLIQIEFVRKLFFELFGIYVKIRLERIDKGENTYYIEPSNKIIYQFLTKVFEVPIGKKYEKLIIPKTIEAAPTHIKQWFLRGLFDADGDTRAVEAGFKSQARIKIRMKKSSLMGNLKKLVQRTFLVSVNGPYLDAGNFSSYLQIERQEDIVKLAKQNFFLHPIKRWRLEKTAQKLVSMHNYLKAIAAESIIMGL